MSKAKYLWSGSQYTQDNWPMNQSDCYLQSSSLLKNFVLYLPDPALFLLWVWEQDYVTPAPFFSLYELSGAWAQD